MIKKSNGRFMHGNVRGNSQEAHGVTKGKHMGGTHGNVFVSDWSYFVINIYDYLWNLRQTIHLVIV